MGKKNSRRKRCLHERNNEENNVFWDLQSYMFDKTLLFKMGCIIH